jgi:hypothetical protein
MRDAIPAKEKLQITLFFYNREYFRYLQHLFRVPKATISTFLP